MEMFFIQSTTRFKDHLLYVSRYLRCYMKLIRNQQMVSVDVDKCKNNLRLTFELSKMHKQYNAGFSRRGSTRYFYLPQKVFSTS